MGGYYGMLVLVGVALSVTSVQCDPSCRSSDGQPGVNGAPGRDGLPGVKGEKGEPAVMVAGPVDSSVLLRLNGEAGSRGLQGEMGPKGYRGNLGASGLPGTAGRPGPNGRSIGQGQHAHQQEHSAFSVMRTETSYPRLNQKVTYQRTVVNNPGDFNAALGVFTCRLPGVYYFNFHSAAKVTVCLNIVTDARVHHLGFCDYNKNYDQVLSGGAVLELTVGQKVWLESFSDTERPIPNNDLRDTREKMIIFNGFLLFSNTE